MEITEVRVKLTEDSDDRLAAFCSITLDDCFVVRDLKIIEGTGGLFVAMPSRKLTAHCPGCGAKNHLRAEYCNHCGGRLPVESAARDAEGRLKLYADVAHPINAECRETIQSRVIEEFQAERERSRQPGYISRYDDDFGDGEVEVDETTSSPTSQARVQPAEREPRPPHRPRSQSLRREAAPGRRSDEFGAGIFPDE